MRKEITVINNKTITNYNLEKGEYLILKDKETNYLQFFTDVVIVILDNNKCFFLTIEIYKKENNSGLQIGYIQVSKDIEIRFEGVKDNV